MVRTLKKPELKKENAEFAESIFQDPKKLEAMKSQVKPELYLSTIYAKIYEKEKELETLTKTSESTRKHLEESFTEESRKRQNSLEELENQLKIKRAERAELDKPFNDKMAILKEREGMLDERGKNQDIKEQKLFERERECENKLEGVQDLADSLGEIRVRLGVKAKVLSSRENTLRDNEMNYLVRVQEFNENQKQVSEYLKTREYELSLKELSVQSREENLAMREQKLLEGNIKLTDQRGILARAWKELELKKK